MQVDQVKTELNAKMKAATRQFLRSKSWEEKVESIERMNAADKLAKAAMRKTLGSKTIDKDQGYPSTY